MWYVIGYVILMLIHAGIFYAYWLTDNNRLTAEDYACIIGCAIFFPIVWVALFIYYIFKIPFIIVDWIIEHRKEQ